LPGFPGNDFDSHFADRVAANFSVLDHTYTNPQSFFAPDDRARAFDPGADPSLKGWQGWSMSPSSAQINLAPQTAPDLALPLNSAPVNSPIFNSTLGLEPGSAPSPHFVRIATSVTSRINTTPLADVAISLKEPLEFNGSRLTGLTTDLLNHLLSPADSHNGSSNRSDLIVDVPGRAGTSRIESERAGGIPSMSNAVEYPESKDMKPESPSENILPNGRLENKTITAEKPQSKPLEGLISIDLNDLEESARRLLQQFSGLDLSESQENAWDHYLWLASAVLGAGGVAYSYKSHTSRRTVDCLMPGTEFLIAR
jgi:hypothetical protein